MNFKREIGRRIKAAREAKSLSLERLSKACKGLLSKTRIGNYEQGERMPGPPEVILLGEVLDVDPAYLMCLEGEMTPLENRMLHAIRKLPENERVAYVKRIEAVALVYAEPVADEKLHIPPVPKAKSTKKPAKS